ncbi:MAG: DUF3761 domain-containing protein [Methylocystis sp.]|uniref:DUF3761 domain-containing protein n=1 Tax=Methylocystis sp. TaxID=1911079 RepID=UPI003DA1E04F
MTRAIFIALGLLLSASFALAKSPLKPELAPGMPIESQLQEHGRYSNSSGEDVHAPAHSRTGGAPDGASARCRDSTYSFSHSRSGTCSRHGGVGEWLR